jgi:hypothetical protein
MTIVGGLLVDRDNPQVLWMDIVHDANAHTIDMWKLELR